MPEHVSSAPNAVSRRFAKQLHITALRQKTIALNTDKELAERFAVTLRQERVMPHNDQEYYYARAEAELKMAETARDPAAVRAHYILAGHYLDRAYGDHGEQGATADQIRARIPIPNPQQ